ncbi:hypothetical protein [Methylobacterium sp. 77]|uniref:hypothetical protein n=1 Tax=Methylobacterium sp. 77 TaxID=1101192 RepID=UPI0012DF8017|nr:hypothetical protein [Methylobacterium sp. 77]
MSNFVKSVVMTLIAFFSVNYLTGNLEMSAALASIPLVLGLVGVMHNLAYSFAALCLVCAVAWFIAPLETKTAVRTEVQKTGITLTAR